MKRLYERNMLSSTSHSFMSSVILKFYSSDENKEYNKKAFDEEFDIKHGFLAEERMLQTASMFWFISSTLTLCSTLIPVIFSLIIGIMIIDPDLILWLTGTLTPLPLLYFIKLHKLRKLKEKMEIDNAPYTPSRGFFVEVRNSDFAVPLVVGIILHFVIFA